MLPSFRTRSSAYASLSHPSFSQALQLLAVRPLRWIPLVLGITAIMWFLGGPFKFHGHRGPPPLPPLPPPDGYGFEVFPPPIGHPHRPPSWRPPGWTASDAWPGRAEKVREAFVHAYNGYRENAFLSDELMPVSGKKVDNFNGWGVTMFDALDTMWIMGLDDHFDEAVKAIENANFTLQPRQFAPFFETVIRYLGGLLSAYALSREPVLLKQADTLGGLLLPAFDTPSGFPMYAINPSTQRTRGGWTGSTLWAEALSNQMEYKYLAHLTGKPEYFEKVERVMAVMYEANVTDGIFPTQWDTATGQPKNTQFSVGAFADSAHEYLLKQWLLTGRSEPKIRDLYLKAAKSIIENLLYVTPHRDFLYVTDANIYHRAPSTSSEASETTTRTTAPPGTSRVPSHTFEHLSCFLPGLFALGVHTLELPPEDKELHSWAAHGLAYSCWLTYADQKTGLGPDEMVMKHYAEDGGRWVDLVKKWKMDGRPMGRPPGLREAPAESKSSYRAYGFRKKSYLLRPETVESFYIMWRTTGDVRWRERGWAVFESIERYAKTPLGYASIVDVDKDEPQLKDEMPSYFLAETLKYLYLLFTDEEIIPLDKWVFNTEAHPLPIFEWKAEEKKAYNITM